MSASTDRDETALWWARCERLEPDALDRWVTSEERARADRFRVAHGRVAFLAGRLLARLAVAHAAGVEPDTVRFRIDDAGRPAVAEPARAAGTPFSISHGGALALCAVAPGRLVGVDVEAVDRPVPAREIAPRCLHPTDRADFDALDEAEQPRSLLEHWTAKEAYAKALGVGLATGFEHLRLVPESGGHVRFVHDAGDARSVHLLRPALDGEHLVALVVDGPTPALRLREACAWYAPGD